MRDFQPLLLVGTNEVLFCYKKFLTSAMFYAIVYLYKEMEKEECPMFWNNKKEPQYRGRNSTLYQIKLALLYEWDVIRIPTVDQYQKLKEWAVSENVELYDLPKGVLCLDSTLHYGGTIVNGLYAVYSKRANIITILEQDPELRDSYVGGLGWGRVVYSSEFLRAQEVKKRKVATDATLDSAKKNGHHQVTIDGVDYEVQGSVTLKGKVTVK